MKPGVLWDRGWGRGRAEVGGGQVCESVSCSACDSDVFGILVFGPQTRNLHPGGSARGGLESGEWQRRGARGRREEGGRKREGG